MAGERIILGVVLFAFFAGCVGTSEGAKSGSSGAPAQPNVAQGPAQFNETSGAVEGLVLNDEGLPLEGAFVAAQRQANEAPLAQVLTDVAGRYVLNNLEPGPYNIAAAKLGYSSAVKRVEVAAGEVAGASFTLFAIEVHEAYHHTFVEDGYFECSWQSPVGTGPCFFPIISDSNSQVNYPLWPNNKRQFDYEVQAGVASVLNEMTWDRTTAATGDRMSLFMSYVGRMTNHWFCRAEGVKPVYLRWDRAMLEDGRMDEDDGEEGTCNTGNAATPSGQPETIPMAGLNLTTRANTGPGNVPVTGQSTVYGIAFQQQFEIYISYFFWEFAPEGWSGLDDK